MFGRQNRREARTRVATQLNREITSLKAEVARLEIALEDVIAASDDVLIDLRRSQLERAQLEKRVASGFADAWKSSDPAPNGFDDFFAAGQVDKRARRWLLSSR